LSSEQDIGIYLLRMDKFRTKTLQDLTETDLRRLYLTELLTETEIAEQYSTTQPSIRRRRIKWEIETLGKTGRKERQLPKLTQQQQELLIGSLLGDGTMNAPSVRTARFSEGHSMKQAPYTEWKAELLRPFTSKVANGKTVREGRTYESRYFTTQTCTVLRPFYDLFYPKGKRVFPSTLPDLMTPFVLAVWFMDDGNLSGRFHPRITFGLDELSRKRAFKALRRLGLRPVFSPDKGSTISIGFPGQSDLFYEKVGPYLHECMEYKLPRESRRRDQDRNARKLTPETARELYDGGMSVTKMAILYGVSRSTVHRRVHTEGAPKRMGRPRRTYSRSVAEEILANVDHKAWGALPVEQQDAQVREVVQVLRGAGFPTPEPWGVSRLKEELVKLVALETGIEEGRISSQSWRGTRACASFFPHRYRSSYRGRASAYEKWHEDKALFKAARFQLRYGDPVLPDRVLQALTMGCRTPGVFRPAVAKLMYETYCPKGGRVWDPCAGWGGRLMGAAAAGVEYVGTDVEPETVVGNQKLAEALGYEAQVVLQPAQTFKVPEVDMVFTSPPYFNVEHYGESEAQSFRSFSTFEKWIEGFMKPLIQRSHEGLRKGGVLALNVADVRHRKEVFPLPDRVKALALEVGFEYERTLGMPLARLNRVKERATEPILVFRRA